MAEQSMGVIALEYTLIGMGVVFLVLLFISFIISLFKYIPGSGAYKKKEKPADKTAAPAKAEPAVAAVAAAQAPAATDDGQLIAVITAAIKAYMDSQGVQGDGYVVRSIRRR